MQGGKWIFAILLNNNRLFYCGSWIIGGSEKRGFPRLDEFRFRFTLAKIRYS